MTLPRTPSSLSVFFRCFFLAVILSVLFIPLPSLAWGPAGHQVVAQIALNHLTPQAKEAVEAILGPDKDLVSVSGWADMVKGKPSKNKPWFKDYSYTKPWHFIDLPVSKKITAADLPQYLHKDDNVIRQIVLQAQILRDPDLPDRQKRDALRFLIHFVGDIHMPLHCAGDGDDEGGNLKRVRFQGHMTNLHALWDLDPTRHPSWSQGTPEDWALESFTIAQKTIYPDYWNRVKEQGKRGIDLPASYAKEMQPIVDERLAKAGMRLAKMLNEIFGRVDRN
jgi:hypothetical protein